jgi:hypothetical protein
MRPVLCLGLVVFFFIFSTPVFAETEPVTLHLPQDAYISNPNPALADVNRLYINVRLRGAYNDSNSAFTFRIEQQVKAVFRDYDINVIDTNVENSPLAMLSKKRFGSVSNLRWRPANVPEFCINIDLLNITDTNQCVYRLQTSFSKAAQLEGGPEAFMRADVWQNEPVMRMVPANDLAEALVAASVSDAKRFIGSWSAATKLKKQIDVNQLGPLGPRLKKATADSGKNSAKQQDTETKYVASKNSKVFHKADCPSAKRILPKNLVTYATREDAVKAGKRPCERCNP